MHATAAISASVSASSVSAAFAAYSVSASSVSTAFAASSVSASSVSAFSISASFIAVSTNAATVIAAYTSAASSIAATSSTHPVPSVYTDGGRVRWLERTLMHRRGDWSWCDALLLGQRRELRVNLFGRLGHDANHAADGGDVVEHDVPRGLGRVRRTRHAHLPGGGGGAVLWLGLGLQL